MATQYDDMAGDESDADSHTDNSHNYTKMAGDVINTPSTYFATKDIDYDGSREKLDTINNRMKNTGPAFNSYKYATGREYDPSVKSIGMDTLKSWSDKNMSRRGGSSGGAYMPKF